MSFVAIAVGSTVVSLTGAYLAYDAQKDAAKVAEKTGEYNAQLQRNQAQTDALVAEENMRRKARENASFLARQRAALAVNGLSMEGTPLAILGETVTTLERDLMDISYRATEENKASIFNAENTSLAGKAAATGLRNQAIASAASSVGSTVTSYGKSRGYLQ